MKKKLFALSGVFLIVLVITGLWATKATDLMSVIRVQEASDPVAVTSQVPGLSMEAMTTGAEAIVIGTCVETKSQWSNDRRRLFTLATVAVAETLKGAEAKTVTVVLPGGIASNQTIPVGMIYAGAPRISRDERVFLFLTPEGEVPGGYAVMGFAEGKYSIVNNDEGEPVVTRDLARVMPKSVGVTRGNPKAIPLFEFKERVKGYLK